MRIAPEAGGETMLEKNISKIANKPPHLLVFFNNKQNKPVALFYIILSAWFIYKEHLAFLTVTCLEWKHLLAEMGDILERVLVMNTRMGRESTGLASGGVNLLTKFCTFIIVRIYVYKSIIFMGQIKFVIKQGLTLLKICQRFYLALLITFSLCQISKAQPILNRPIIKSISLLSTTNGKNFKMFIKTQSIFATVNSHATTRSHKVHRSTFVSAVVYSWWESRGMKFMIVMIIFATILIIQKFWIKKIYDKKLNSLQEKFASEKYLIDFMMDKIPISIYFKDKESRFVRVSKFMTDSYKKSEGELIGKTDFDIQDEKHSLDAFADELTIMQTGIPKIDYLEKELHHDGKEKWVSTTKMPLYNSKGELIGTFGISKDITQIKLQESKIEIQNKILTFQQGELASQNEELMQSQEEISAQRDLLAIQNTILFETRRLVEEKNNQIIHRNETLEEEVNHRTKDLVEYNQQLEQFAFISAHNLRAPVARILGLGQVLKLLDSNSEEREQIFEKLISTTQELDQVVKDLNTVLDMRRDSTSVITEVNLVDELEIIKRSLEAEIEETKAEIITDFSNGKVFHTVKPYLDSILMNLLSNAIKYRHPDRNPIIEMKSEFLDEYICLTVKDNGLGLDLALHKNKLYNLYSRFHNHVEGKGMGLYLVKTQITAMGGKIEIESEVDKGLMFKIYFKIHSV